MKLTRAPSQRDERVLVVWAYNLDHIIPIVQDFEDKLIRLVWRTRPAVSSSVSAITGGSIGTLPPSGASTQQKLVENSQDDAGTESQEGAQQRGKGAADSNQGSSWLGWRTTKGKAGLTTGDRTEKIDVELGDETPELRPIRLLAPIYAGLGVGMSLFFIGSGVNTLVTEWILDGDWRRFLFLVTAPFLFCVALFFSLQLIGNIAYVIGPVAQFHENSKYYSAVAPKPNKQVDNNLPHITIQMPVYKESLTETMYERFFVLSIHSLISILVPHLSSR